MQAYNGGLGPVASPPPIQMWSIFSIKIKHISVHLTSECLYTILLLEVPVRHTGPYRQTLSPGHRHRSHWGSRPQKEYWGARI